MATNIPDSTLSMDVFRALTPLKVLIVSEQDSNENDDQQPFFNAITRAFQGGTKTTLDGTEEYYATGGELGVDVRRFVGEKFWGNMEKKIAPKHSPPNVGKIITTCGHLLIIVFLKGEASANSWFGKWLDEVSLLASKKPYDVQIGILPILFDTEAGKTSLKYFNAFQRLAITELGETALRAGYLGLLSLQNAWVLVGAGSKQPIKLFVSHAKLDGAPIALALKSQIESLRFLQRFYDAQNILPGERWQQALQEGVQTSVLVVLRTDIYEQRSWCVQELEWAEQFGGPAVVVDLRNSLAMPREALPVAGMSTVKIHDGNLVRILNEAMREALRVRLFERSIQLLEDAGALKVRQTIRLTRASISALGIACQDRVNDAIDAVVVSEPFRQAYRPAAVKLVDAYFGGKAMLGTLTDFAVRGKIS